MSICSSVPPIAWNISASTGRIFINFDIWVFFEDLSRRCKFRLNLTRITGTLHEDLCTFMVISRLNLYRIGNFTDISVENTKTHILYSITFPRKLYRLWDNCGEKIIVESDRTRHNTTRRIAWWIPSATDTHTHTLRICNNYCFSNATIRLNALPVLLIHYTTKRIHDSTVDTGR
jgi:hypothetical protein